MDGVLEGCFNEGGCCCVVLVAASSSVGTVAAEHGCLLFFFFFSVFLSCVIEVADAEGNVGPMSFAEAVDPNCETPVVDGVEEEAPFSTEVVDVEADGGMAVFT